jgi:hypothetical protein
VPHRLVTALSVWLAVAAPAAGQLGPIGFDAVPPPSAAEAFAAPYGARIVDEVAAVFRESADPACLRASGRAAPTREETLGWLVRYGQQALDRFAGAIDRRAAEAAFLAAEGGDALAEAARLARDDKVRELMVQMRPIQLNLTVDFVLERVFNHLLREGVGLAGRIDFPSSDPDRPFMRERRAGDERLAEQVQLRAALESPEFVRLVDLANRWTMVSMERMDLAQAGSAAVEGLAPELRAACIGRR